jgi:hypothetical protein
MFYKLYLLYYKAKIFFLKNPKSLLIIISFLIFFVRAVIFLDPDFGWRLRTGEMILKTGVPKTDPFTYSMPEFPFVDHAWLQSAFMAFVYNNFGYAGLAFVYTFLAFSALALVTRLCNLADTKKVLSFTEASLDAKFSYFANVAFLLTLYTFFLFFGIRAQVTSWLMLTTLLIILFDLKKWKKWKYSLPLFFLLWSNLHGSFFLGISVFTAFLFLKAVKERHVDVKDVLILILCVLASFINPYHLSVWREAWSSVSDQGLRWTIAEWMPTLIMANLPIALFISLSLAFVIKNFKKLSLRNLFFYFTFLVAALSTRRHLPLWAIVTYSILTTSLALFYNSLRKYKGGLKRLNRVYRFFWLGVVFIILIQGYFDFKGIVYIREGTYYPKEAVLYLEDNLPDGRIFSRYGWGGYLIWKLPEKKVFIDGRMPSWRWKPEGELATASAFDDYNGILEGEIDYEPVFDKYGIDTVLWDIEKEKGFLDKLSDKVMQYFGKDKDFDFLGQLEEDGWNKIYEDGIGVIYQKH